MKIAFALFFAGLIASALSKAEPVYSAPSLGLEDVKSLGTYEVTSIKFKSAARTHDSCIISDKNRELDRECGRRVWAVRMGGELALFVASEKPTQLRSWLMLPSLVSDGHPSCTPDMSLWDARNVLFCSEFCRAFKAKTAPGTPERFDFKQPIQFSSTAWQLGGLGIVLDPLIGNGLGSHIEITLPAGDATQPRSLSVLERVTSIVMMVPVSFDRTYTLKRIGD